MTREDVHIKTKHFNEKSTPTNHSHSPHPQQIIKKYQKTKKKKGKQQTISKQSTKISFPYDLKISNLQ